MSDSPDPRSEETREDIADHVNDVAKRRLIPIALITLEQTMLNGKQDKDKVTAANSVLDRFGHPVKGQAAQVLAFPIPAEYMQNMAKALASAFQGDKDNAIDVVSSAPAEPRRLPSDGSGAGEPQ